MAKGRVFEERDSNKAMIRELGTVSIKRAHTRSREAITIWIDNPDTLLELVGLALKNRNALDFFPEHDADLYQIHDRVAKFNGFFNVPYLVPYRPKEGQVLKILSGRRATRSGDPKPVTFLHAILSTPENLQASRREARRKT